MKTLDARLTAQLVVSEHEAYIAYTTNRDPLGPNGEPEIAHVLHTTDGGKTWLELPWNRSLGSRVRHPGYPTWPPENVLNLALIDGNLLIQHRDEWVPYEPGGESLWQSTLRGTMWHNRKLRAMDYDDADSPGVIPTVQLSLPAPMHPPKVFVQQTTQIQG